jgi:hypothetical protein
MRIAGSGALIVSHGDSYNHYQTWYYNCLLLVSKNDELYYLTVRCI